MLLELVKELGGVRRRIGRRANGRAVDLEVLAQLRLKEYVSVTEQEYASLTEYASVSTVTEYASVVTSEL